MRSALLARIVVCAWLGGCTGARPFGQQACELRLSEFDAVAPESYGLLLWPPETVPDDCPAGFDAARLLDDPSACAAETCKTATVGARRVVLMLDGPGGSGRFWALGLAVTDGERRGFACMTASTVGWRGLSGVADAIGELPWLEDLDGDGAAELIVWQRLPWGASEASNGLAPAVYRIGEGRLRRSDATGAALAAKIAGAYRQIVGADACQLAMADVLARWGQR